jgi:predicted pyridoxine 5'-phosphate oxidase superfamily flavin-nucleotide-binding protein
MVKMPKEVIEVLEGWHTVPMATVGEDGKPNVAAKGVMIRDEETLIFTELYFRQTYHNLVSNPIASVCFWLERPPYTAYKLNGRIEMYEEGSLVEEMEERMRMGHKDAFSPRGENLAAYLFHIEEIYDQTPSLEAGGKQIA